MKASEEIAIDYFIKRCIQQGIDNHHEIVEAAREEDRREAKRVREFLLNGQSNPYEHHIEWESCIDCGGNLMFDENEEDYYCPICEP